MDPKAGDVGASVGVPVRVLPSRCSVKVEDGVDALLSAEVDDAIEVLEALFLENPGVHVIWETCDKHNDRCSYQGMIDDHLRNVCS